MKKRLIGAACVVLASCSPVLEATRPEPVDFQRFVKGQSRVEVLADLGAPTATTPDAGNSCDIYKLFTKGPNGVGKGAIAAGEIVADVLTLGLAEVILTPVEAATRNSKHTVVFCYGGDNKLVSIKESENPVDH